MERPVDFPIVLPNRHELASASRVERPYRSLGHGKETMPVLAEHFDLDKAKAEDMAALCMDSDLAIKAAEICAAAHKTGADSPPTEKAVYIIDAPDKGAAKIGIAKRPLARLATLQSSCFTTLELRGLFWCVDGQSEKLEFQALRAARQAGLGLRGEWFEASPELLGLVVATVAATLKLKVADSAMWLRQREAIRRQVYHWDTGGYVHNKNDGIIHKAA